MWCAVLLAYAPIVGGWIGLASRPVLQAAAQHVEPQYEFSGKGAILGSLAAFFLALAFTPAQADRTALVALFLASSSFYYALGKVGCLFIGCCPANSERRMLLPLPAIEAGSSSAIGIAALLTLFGTTTVRLWSFLTITGAFLLLRVVSRYARGSGLRGALRQLDSIALAAVACCVTFVALVAQLRYL